MGGAMPEPAATGIAVRIAAFFAAIFFLLGVAMAYAPLWLQAIGLGPTAVAALIASPMLARLVVTPALGVAVDTATRPHLLIVGIAAMALAGMVLLTLIAPATSPPPGDGEPNTAEGARLLSAILAGAVLMVVTLAVQSLIPLGEDLSLRAVRVAGIDYGRARLWGSLAFVGGTLGGGYLVAGFGPSAVTAMMLAGSVALVAAAWASPRFGQGNTVRGLSAATAAPTEPLAATGAVAVTGSIASDATRADQGRPSRLAGLRTLLASRTFLVFGLATALVQASHAVFYAFSAIHWSARGIDGGTIGWLWTVGVLAEVALFAVAGRWRGRITPLAWLMAGVGAALIRWPLTALDPPLAALFALQTLHAFTFGATHLATIGFIERHVAPERGATAQSLYAALAAGVVMGAVMWASGPLFAAHGAGAFLAMAGVAAVGGSLGVFFIRRDGRALGAPL